MARLRKALRFAGSPTPESRRIDATCSEFFRYHERRGSAPAYREELLSYLVGHGQRTDWQPLVPWAKANGLEYLHDLTGDRLKDYLEGVSRSATRGVYAKLCALLARFLRFAVAEGFLDRLPLEMPRPRAPKAKFSVFTREEMQRLVQVVRKENVRDQAIFAVFLDTGMRSSEVCSLRLQDVRLVRQEVVVRATVAKNRTERVIPLGASVPALRKYLAARGESVEQTESFFLSFYASPAYAGGSLHVKRRTLGRLQLSAAALTRIGMYHLVSKWGRLAGITEARCSPHTFRHLFAVEYLRGGGDLVSLQRILGHSKLSVTETYLRFVAGDVREVHRRVSPALRFLASRHEPLSR